MHSEIPLTRRDVVTIVIYAAFACNVIGSLLSFLCVLISPRISLFQTSLSGSNLFFYAINAGLCLAFALAFLPFVSLMAGAVVGRTSPDVSTGKRNLSLVSRCSGLLLFVNSLPHFAQSLYNYWQASSLGGSASSSIRPFYLQYLFVMLVCLSAGFIFAFFPAMLASLRGPDEENAD